MTGAEYLFGLVLIGLFCYLCSEFYWVRVTSVACLLLVWAGGPLLGAYVGLAESCSRVSASCIIAIAMYCILFGLLGMPWWIAFTASLGWLRENPPKGKSPFSRIN